MYAVLDGCNGGRVISSVVTNNSLGFNSRRPIAMLIEMFQAFSRSHVLGNSHYRLRPMLVREGTVGYSNENGFARTDSLCDSPDYVSSVRGKTFRTVQRASTWIA